MLRRTLALALVLVFGSPAWAPPTAADEPTPAAELRVSEQRLVELPDTRVVSLSPDGRWLAAVRNYPDGPLCTYAVATLAEQACGDLAPLEAGLRVEDVVWSPDGAHLAFAEQTFLNFRDGDLWVMDATTGTVTNVDDDGFAGNLPLFRDVPHDAPISMPVAPAFSPDGRSVAFSRSLIVDSDPAGNELAVVPVDGGTPERLALVSPEIPGVIYFGVRWAPDASRLYYSVHYPERDHPDNGIWSVAADGSDQRHLLGVDPALGGPSVVQVSPRGDTLLAYYPLAAGMGVPAADLYAVVDLATGAATPVTLDDPDAAEPADVSLATFSPDGSKLLYAGRLLMADDFRVYARDVDGGAEVLLAKGLLDAAPWTWGIQPTWATDGSVFILAGGHVSSGTLLRLEGGAATPPIVASPQPATPVAGARQRPPSLLLGVPAVSSSAL